MYNLDDAIQECREKFGEDKPYFSGSWNTYFAGCKALSRLRDEKVRELRLRQISLSQGLEDSS
ncbi:hypothetical protein [Mannheimia haemolytica]|uniref:hypothetical protein n=1 Tax=Mannheimia haemolytica TaxID=75985 RepID=UPI001EFF03BC|nr:hypothetical protein [Mannheimia haemolytica]